CIKHRAWQRTTKPYLLLRRPILRGEVPGRTKVQMHYPSHVPWVQTLSEALLHLSYHKPFDILLCQGHILCILHFAYMVRLGQDGCDELHGQSVLELCLRHAPSNYAPDHCGMTREAEAAIECLGKEELCVS